MVSLVPNRKFTMKHIPTILLKILPSYLSHDIKDKNRFYRIQVRETQISMGRHNRALENYARVIAAEMKYAWSVKCSE
jgi:hypothetical protein